MKSGPKYATGVLGHFTYKIVILGYPPFSRTPYMNMMIMEKWNEIRWFFMVGERLIQKNRDFVSSNPRNPNGPSR